MPTPSLESLGISAASVPLLFSIVGGVLGLLLFADYFRRKRAEVATVAAAASAPDRSADDHKAPKPAPSATKKSQPRSHFHHNDKDHSKKHHPLHVNTLKGDGVVVTALCFSSGGHNFATDGLVVLSFIHYSMACSVVWIHSAKNYKFLLHLVPMELSGCTESIMLPVKASSY